MNIYFISPIGYYTKELFPTFIETFVSKGHSVVNDINAADVVFWDLFSWLGNFDIKVACDVINNKIPVVVFDAVDYGAMSKEKWWYHNGTRDDAWHEIIMECKTVYFMRKMDKTVSYPSWVYPYEVCYYKDHDFKPVSKEELFNRPFDICLIANTSPTRVNVVNGLKDHFKCDFILGEERLPHEAWLNRHRLSKFFISADGGGFSDERAQQLFSVSPMIKQINNQLVLNDFISGVDCIKIDEHPSREDILELSNILNNKDKLYSIYLKGIDRMKTYFSEEYRANYILETLKKAGIC